MKAVKGNKEYMIDESQQKFYQDGGFDIIGDDGDVIAYGRGKTVPYEAHVAALKEIEKLHKKIAELEAGEESPTKENGEPVAEESEKKRAAGKKAGE